MHHHDALDDTQDSSTSRPSKKMMHIVWKFLTTSWHMAITEGQALHKSTGRLR
jgi:hypothetical protein